MPRGHRHEQPGWIYHVTTRGNDRQPIQLDDVDCGTWERMVARVTRRYSWEVLSYCLMGNHAHLLVRIPLGGLSAGMCLLNGGYAREFNRRHGRSDHVFGRRFWSKPVATRAYLLGSIHYIAWNPVLADRAGSPEEYVWSSHAAMAGRREPPSFLAVDALLEVFGADSARALIGYLGHVANGQVPVPGTVTSL
jgi:REP element-mobilizing transposase RayT